MEWKNPGAKLKMLLVYYEIKDFSVLSNESCANEPFSGLRFVAITNFSMRLFDRSKALLNRS